MTNSLSEFADSVDRELADIDNCVHWLHYLSPLNNDYNWEHFRHHNFSVNPDLRYPDIPDNYDRLKERLRRLPIDQIEEPLLKALFIEKAIELEMQIDLVLFRDTESFLPISIELFGGAEPSLLALARRILQTTPHDEQVFETANHSVVAGAAEAVLALYREQAGDISASVDVVDDLNSMIMVDRGNLKIARSIQVPLPRIDPLIAHEVGVHIVTHYNGQQQSSRLFAHGLAHYDGLQEGLGTLAEFLAGYLPAARLRVIAARVVATDMAIKDSTVVQIFELLRDEYHLSEMEAFDTAVRALRGGGLTKDSVYLRGLNELVAYLASGKDLVTLHLGKFSMDQVDTVEKLLDDQWLHPPTLLPTHMTSNAGRDRLQRVKHLTLEQLYQSEPML